MKRRALLFAGVAVACRAAPRSASPLARSVLELSRQSISTGVDQEWALDELARIGASVLSQQRAGLTPARALAKVLFEERGFVREVDSPDLKFVLLSSVLQLRRGSCVGLGSVYLCVAETIGYRAHGMLRPGHFYVRQEAPGPSCNVELLRRGELMPDAWYEERFPLTRDGARSYGRPLSEREVVGVVAFNVGNERRRQRQLTLAERAYRAATVAFPTFAEAHASLGVTQHLLGRYADAAMSYHRARELEPNLPGLADDIALLPG